MVSHRLIYDEKAHGLPPLIGAKQKELPTRQETAAADGSYTYLSKNLIKAHVIETERTSEWNFEVDKGTRIELNNRKRDITALDEVWIMSKLGYKSWETFENRRTIFAQIKIRWAKEMSNKEIESQFKKLELEAKESTIKKVTFALNRSHEEEDGTLDLSKHTPLKSLIQQKVKR